MGKGRRKQNCTFFHVAELCASARSRAFSSSAQPRKVYRSRMRMRKKSRKNEADNGRWGEWSEKDRTFAHLTSSHLSAVIFSLSSASNCVRHHTKGYENAHNKDTRMWRAKHELNTQNAHICRRWVQCNAVRNVLAMHCATRTQHHIWRAKHRKKANKTSINFKLLKCSRFVFISSSCRCRCRCLFHIKFVASLYYVLLLNKFSATCVNDKFP